MSIKIADMQVDYVDHMGSDVNVVNAARVSFAKEVKDFDLEKDTKLINYLAEHNHFTPLCHTSVTIRVKAPIFMARQFVKHQIGLCLSGDTDITFVKKVKGVSNGTYTKKLSQIADMWFGKIKYQGGAKGRRNVSGSHIRVFNEDTQRFEESHIVNVIDSGMKDVYKVTDSFGNSIKATEDHQFLTDKGWKKVKELTIDDLLIRSDVGKTFSKKSKRCNNSDDVIIRRGFRKSFKDEDTCDCCGEAFNKSDLIADHIVAVSHGGEHTLDNMQKLCKQCHNVKSNEERSEQNNTTLLPKYVNIVSIVLIGEEQCYDISVDNIHNFLGNGFVVHNCWNEESRRYIDDEPEFYIPKEWRGRPVNAKQGSSEQIIESLRWNDDWGSQEPSTCAGNVISASLYCYNNLLESGVAPEQARMVLPQNTMTNWVWTGSLVAFARVVKLRTDSHAQQEAQELAKLINDVVAPLYPVSWEALMEN